MFVIQICQIYFKYLTKAETWKYTSVLPKRFIRIKFIVNLLLLLILL